MYVVEFQKRGLPHAHFLLIMEGCYKITRLEQYDLLILTELPNKKYPDLYKMVTKHMMHGPCGALNRNSHAQMDVVPARTVNHDLFVTPQYSARIHTQFIDNVKTGEKKMFVDMSLTIDGSCLTTHIYYVCSTVILMLRHVGASRQLNTCSNTFIRVMTGRLWL